MKFNRQDKNHWWLIGRIANRSGWQDYEESIENVEWSLFKCFPKFEDFKWRRSGWHRKCSMRVEVIWEISKRKKLTHASYSSRIETPWRSFWKSRKDWSTIIPKTRRIWIVPHIVGVSDRRDSASLVRERHWIVTFSKWANWSWLVGGELVWIIAETHVRTMVMLTGVIRGRNGDTS